MVEHDLPKVEAASSSLVPRSMIKRMQLARWTTAETQDPLLLEWVMSGPVLWSEGYEDVE